MGVLSPPRPFSAPNPAVSPYGNCSRARLGRQILRGEFSFARHLVHFWYFADFDRYG